MEEILDHLPPGSRVLDLGSRDGSFLASAYPRLILIAADLFLPNKIQEGIRFVQTDASSLPFASRSFDAIILNHTLEHFERLKPALQEIGRVIRPDGAIYVPSRMRPLSAIAFIASSFGIAAVTSIYLAAKRSCRRCLPGTLGCDRPVPGRYAPP